MTLKTSILYLMFIFGCNFLKAQSTFQKTFGGTSMEDANSIIPTSDNNFVIVGSTASYGEGLYDVYLIKINSFGDTIWTRTYGGINNDYGFNVEETNDGGFVIIASTTSFGSGPRDMYLIRTDNNGYLLWSKTYGGINTEEGLSVSKCTDSGFIVSGWTYSYGSGQRDVYLIRTNSIGDTLWTKTYGGASNDYGYCVKQTLEGGFVVVGYTYILGQGLTNVLLIKTDTLGDTLWSKTYGGTQFSWAYCVQQTSDSGFVLIGNTTSFGANPDDIYMVKTDVNGNVQWSKTYGGVNQDIGTYVKQTNDNGYIILGITQSFGAGSADIYLIKTDSVGSLIWSKTYGGSSYDYAYAVLQTEDSGYLIAGRTASFGMLDDIFLIKTDSNGLSDCNTFDANTSSISQNTITTNVAVQISSGALIGNPDTKIKGGSAITTLCATGNFEQVSFASKILIYPNPFSYSTVIYTENVLTDATLNLYDSYGRAVKKLNNLSGNSIYLDRNSLPKGIYFLWLTMGDYSITKEKLVIVD